MFAGCSETVSKHTQTHNRNSLLVFVFNALKGTNVTYPR
jgi:hypothetical protein